MSYLPRYSLCDSSDIDFIAYMNEVNDVAIVIDAATVVAGDLDNDGNGTHILKEAGGNKVTG